jgi:Na+/proline symporter
MPVGLVGLVLASIFAMAMSNASGSLNALASSSVLDLHAGPVDSVHPLRFSRRMTLIWGIVLASLGMVRWGPVLVAGLTIASITYGGLLGVFLLGTWNRRANENGALAGFFTGIAVVAGIAILSARKMMTPLAWTWYVLVGTLVTFAVGTLASLIGSRSARRTAASNETQFS